MDWVIRCMPERVGGKESGFRERAEGVAAQKEIGRNNR
jgi:hypothetical protein